MTKIVFQYGIPALLVMMGASLIAGGMYVAGGLVAGVAGRVFIKTRRIINAA